MSPTFRGVTKCQSARLVYGCSLVRFRVVWYAVCSVCKSHAKPGDASPGRGGRHRLAISGGASIFGWCSAWHLQGVQVSCQKSFFGSEKCQEKSISLLTRKIAKFDTIAAKGRKCVRRPLRASQGLHSCGGGLRFGTPFATRARAGILSPESISEIFPDCSGLSWVDMRYS